MVGPEDIGQIVASKYKPIFRFMVVVFGVIIYIAYWSIRGYNVYIDQNKHISDLKQEVKKLQAQDVVTRKHLARIMQHNSEALRVMFERHDIIGDMAQDNMPQRRKTHYRDRVKEQRRKEVEVLLQAGQLAQ